MKVEDKKTILLVEDEAILAMSEEIDLESFGYSVITVNTGEEAIKAVKSIPEIDLILMDINLGTGIDGTQAAEIILNELEIPIVFLSSHMEPEIVQKTEGITSYGYVVKSSSITVLDASIKMAFKLFNAHKEINQQNILIKAGNENLRLTIEELETGRNRLASIFRAAPTGIGVVIDRILVEVNQRFCEMTGYEEEELIGRTARLLYRTQEDFDYVGREKYAQIKLKGTGTVETQLKCKDGKIIDALLSSTPLDPNDYAKGVTFTALDITERKKVENGLQASEEKFSKIFQGSNYPIMIIDTENGCFADVNDSTIKGLGYSKEELIGRTAVELGILKPESEHQIKKLITETGQFLDLEIMVRTKSGKPRYGLATGQLVVINKHTYMIQTIKDITEHKYLENDLTENMANMYSLINNRNESIWSIDKNYNYVIFNDFFKESYYTTYNVELKRGMNALNILPPELEDIWKSKYDRALSGEIVTFEFTSQIDHFHEVSLNPITTGKKITGVTALSIDITKYKIAEEKIKTLLAEKEIIIKEVHHRVKNNMNTLMSLLSLQADALSDNSSKAVLCDAKNHIRNMMILYDKLYQSDNFSDIHVNEYFPPLVGEVLNSFSNSDIINFDLAVDNFVLDAEKTQTLAIIINEVLTNIMKHAFPDKNSGFIQITLKENNGEITLTIQDNGRGLPDDFEIGLQKGFGLLLINMLSKQLGGIFNIENNDGTRNIIKFPL